MPGVMSEGKSGCAGLRVDEVPVVRWLNWGSPRAVVTEL